MSNVIVDKLESLKRGERIIVSDADLDALSELDGEIMNHVRSIPNANRVGILDAYVAWIKSNTEVSL